MIDPNDPFAAYTWLPRRSLMQQVADEFGTPTFVYSELHLKKAFSDLKDNLDPSVSLFYSLKANPNLGVTQTLVREGAGCEVSSAGELYAAQCTGGARNGIIFVGPGKSDNELRAIASADDVVPVCESLDELARFNNLRKQMRKNWPLRTLIRVNPAFQTKGSKLSMGGKPRQFGIDEATLYEARGFLETLEHIEIVGFHAYLGTRILDADTIAENTQRLLTLYGDLATALNISLEMVDIGGGFGVPYYEKEVGLAPIEIALVINEATAAFRKAYPSTRVIIELGRYLTAGAGAMLVKILDIKESRGKTFAIADGGTNIHMAANGLGSFAMKTFPIVAYSSASRERAVYTISGPLCTPNDLLAKDIELNQLTRGDLATVLMSGAYGPSASPTGFLSHGYPAEVMITETNEPLALTRRPSVTELFERQETP